MKNSKFSTPLLQSAAVLAVSLVFFGFVVSSSGSHSLLGSLWAIVTGIFYTIVYAIGLTVGVTFCIAFLLAIFLGALYLISNDQAISIWQQIKATLLKYSSYMRDIGKKWCTSSCNIDSGGYRDTQQTEINANLLQKVADLEAQLDALKRSEKRNAEILNKLYADKNIIQ